MSEIHVLEWLEVVDLWKLLVERLPRGKELQEGRSRHWLDDESVALLMEESLLAWKLQISRNTHCLVTPVPEQAHNSIGLHGFLPAARSGLCQSIG
jgi:hypothetical protein